MSRYAIWDTEQRARVEELLDEAGIDYDWDSGDRLMVDDVICGEVEAIFDDNSIDYDCI